MKATIVGQPEFVVYVDAPTLEGIVRVGHHHYDGSCKAACKPYGFIYGWLSRIKFETTEGLEVSPIRATFRQLDLTLKILEMINYEFNEGSHYRLLCQAYDKRIRQVLMHWTCMNHGKRCWEEEVPE